MLTQKLDLPYYLMLIIDLDSIKKTFSVPDDFIFNSISLLFLILNFIIYYFENI